MSKKEVFFNNDARAGPFIAANYPNQDYTSCGDCNDELLKYIMKSNFQNNSQNNDESIHAKFTDFIVLVAKFHREIDEPIGGGRGINAITRSCYELLDKKCSHWGITKLEVEIPQ